MAYVSGQQSSTGPVGIANAEPVCLAYYVRPGVRLRAADSRAALFLSVAHSRHPRYCIHLIVVVLSLLAFARMNAQVAGGTPSYASVSGGPDQVNLSNLNVQFVLPILHRTGRGQDFDLNLTYNSAFYAPVEVGSPLVSTWSPATATMGWSIAGGELPNNYVSATFNPGSCYAYYPDPAPTISMSAGGTLPSGTYYVTYVWQDANGNKSIGSVEAEQQLNAEGSLIISGFAGGVVAPTTGTAPTPAVQADIYIGTAQGAETYQGSVANGGGPYTQSVPLRTGGVAPPAACSGYTYSDLTYIDTQGHQHPFNGEVIWTANGTFEGMTNAPSTDGSGILLTITQPPGNSFTLGAAVTFSSGAQFTVPYTDNGKGGTANTPLINQDANGNYVTASVGASSTLVGNQRMWGASFGTFTDTLGNKVLTIAQPQSNVGSAYGAFSYPVASGGTATITPVYTNFIVKTNFGCSGVAEFASGYLGPGYYGPTYVPDSTPVAIPLLTSIALPDGRSYSFTYEPSGTQGAVTGRIQSITLPSGGSITYSYTVQNGVSINCGSGSPLGFTRTVNDGQGHSFTWTYGPSPLNAGAIRVTDPTGAFSDHTFILLTSTLGPLNQYGPEYVETSSLSYNSSGTLLETVTHTYTSPNTPQGVTNFAFVPITGITTTTSIPNASGVTSKVVQTQDGLGESTETDVYDYGTGGTPGPLLSKTVTTYASEAPFFGHPSSITSYGPNGTTITAQTKMFYDQFAVQATSGVPNHTTGINVGNLTTVQKLVSGTNNWLTSTSTYNDTGTIATTTDVNHAVTTFTYSQCGNSLLGGSSTVVSGGSSLSTSETWDCTSGAVASSTDFNGNTTSMSYGDPYGRVTSSNDALGNETVYSYPTNASNTSQTTTTFNGGSSVTETLNTYDGLGRSILQQQRQGPSSSNYDSIAVKYNSLGQTQWSSAPYVAAAGSYITTGPGVSSTYDGLGRPQLVTDAGGGYEQYVYTGNDVAITSGPAPAGESAKVRILQSDGSGALTSVCEVTSMAASGSCGQLVSGTGYLTKYTRTPGSLVVQQNVQPNGTTQTRSVSYDLLGRTLSETVPETGENGVPGTTIYEYDADSTGTCSGSYPGDLVYRKDNAGNVICFTYDNHHRLLSSHAASGQRASVTADSYYIYDVGSFNGVALQDAKGNLAEAYTCTNGSNCSTKLTDYLTNAYPESNGSEPTGRLVQQTWESTPDSGGYFTSKGAYYPNGSPGSFSASIMGTPSTGYFTLSGGERTAVVGYPCGNSSCPESVPDVGQVVVTIGGNSISINYGPEANSQLEATIAQAINSSSTMPVTATVSGANIQLTSKAVGSNTNYALSGNAYTTDTQYFSGSSFTITPSAPTMTGATENLVALAPAVTYALDGEGRVSSVTDTTNSINLVSAVTYDPSSAPTLVTYGNNDADSYTHDPNTERTIGFGQTITGTSGFTNTGALTWNPNGSLHQFVWTDGTDSSKSQTCTYSADDLNRAASVNCGTKWAQTFAYDPFGNVTKTANGGTSYTAVYSSATNQVKSGVSATYDANGNQTMTNFVTSINWNALGQSVSAGGTAMIYDALGRLVEFTGTEIVYGPMGEKIAAMSNGSTLASISLPGGGEALYNSLALLGIRHKDWLGSSLLLTSWTHTVLSKTSFAPYGEDYDTAGTADLDFTGKTQDSIPSLFDYPARKYDPNAGRWLSPDPAGWSVVDFTNPQTLNRYAYVLNSPLNAVDPTGEDCSISDYDDGTSDCSEAELQEVYGTAQAALPSTPCHGDPTGCKPPKPPSAPPSCGLTCQINNLSLLMVFIPNNVPYLVNMFNISQANAQAQIAHPAPNRVFLPPNALTCTGMGRQFYAPSGYNLSNVVAAGSAGGKLNIFAMNRAVGHFGTFDYQRAGTPSSFTFYRGLTPVSNMDVGAYLYGAGFTQSQAGTVSNTFADLFSSNAGDPNQAIYRNFGYQLAASGGSYTCSTIPQ